MTCTEDHDGGGGVFLADTGTYVDQARSPGTEQGQDSVSWGMCTLLYSGDLFTCQSTVRSTGYENALISI